VPHDYWAEWRSLVKGINPQAYTVGEIWGDGTPWLRGDNFDAVMNYVWRDAVVHFVIERKLSPSGYDQAISSLLGRHPTQVNLAMFNLLGSHDTPRILTEAAGAVDRVKLALILQMTYVGAPVIYYGDEIGMEGGKDPDCRRAFPWDDSRWNHDLRRFVRHLIALRRATPALRSPSYQRVLVDDARGVYAYRRGEGGESLLVAVNNSDSEQRVSLTPTEWSGGSDAVDLLSGEKMAGNEGEVEIPLPPLSGRIVAPLHAPHTAAMLTHINT